MANPTTNFGWVMPTSSSLVTNLPADFNTFGQGVDTSMAQLKGGTTGQILSKTSATDMAFTWITNDVGDITAVTAGTGISGGGTSGAVTITNSMATEITAKGDLIAGTGSATFDNLPVGTNGQTLVADSTASTGLKWATPATAASGLTLIKKATFSGAANTGTTFDDTLSATYDNYFLVYTFSASTTTDDWRMQFRYAGPTTEAGGSYNSSTSTQAWNASPTYSGQNNGTFILLQADMASSTYPIAGDMTITNRNNNRPSITASWFNAEYNLGCTAFGNCWTSRTYTGFIFSSSSSNIAGTVAVYGLAIA